MLPTTTLPTPLAVRRDRYGRRGVFVTFEYGVGTPLPPMPWPGVNIQAKNDRLLVHVPTNLAGQISLPPPSVSAVGFKINSIASVERLRSYQREALDFMVRSGRPGTYLALDMGLGKCFTAISAAQAVDAKLTLISGPKYLASTWQDELIKWGAISGLDDPAFKALKGRRKPHQLLEGAEGLKWVFCHYEILASWATVFTGRYQPKVVILDELTECKNPKAARTQGANVVIGKPDYVWGLSGTPIPNRRVELHSQLDLIERGAWGSRGKFRARYCGLHRDDRGHPVDGEPTNSEELDSRLANVMFKRTKKDVALELPPLTHNVVRVEGESAADMARLKLVMGSMDVDQVVSHILSGGGLGRGTLEAYTECWKIASWLKVEATSELAMSAANAGEKVIVFTWFRETADRLGAVLRAPAVHGGKTDKAREAAVSMFRGGGSEVPILVATYKTLGMGVNLQVASQVVIHDLPLVPLLLLQAINRAYRMGQESRVVAHYMTLKHSFDEVVGRLLVDKWGDISQLEAGRADESAEGLMALGNFVGEAELKDAVEEMFRLAGI